MPYMIVHHTEGENAGKWCVHDKNTDGTAGPNRGCSDTEEMAKKHMAAMYANEPNAGRSQKPRLTRGGVERRDMLLQDIELRIDGDSGAPTVSGYASVWDALSEVLFEWDTGKFRERFSAGAFAKTIREQNIPLLVEHVDLPLATTKAGTLQLAEDGHGLRFSSVLDPTDPDVQRIVPKMRRGDMNKMSFAFVPVRESWDEKAKPRLRTVIEAKLFDVSIVARPAYPATEANVRKQLADDGLDAENIADLLVRLRQGMELDDEDRLLMRRLVDTCQGRITDTATVAEAAPGTAHPANAGQPANDKASAPDEIVHPLSYYRERLRAVRKLCEVGNGPGERTHQA